MEINFILCYTGGHETSGKPSATGKASPPSHPIAGRGQDFIGGGKKGALFGKFRVSLATSIPTERRRRARLQTGSRASCQAFRGRKTATGRDSLEGPNGSWLPDGPVDDATGGGSDSKDFWSPVSSQSYLATVDRNGLELPEAGTKSPRTGRSRNRTLEKVSLAGHKKKPPHLAPIWYFWMKAVSFSSLLSAGRGLRRGRRRSCIISTNGKGFLRSLLLPFLPRDDIWGFITIFKNGTSGVSMWQSFCAIFSFISAGMLSFYGTRLLSTGENLSLISSSAILGFMWNGFQHMLLSSIRQSTYGLRRSENWQTAFPKEQRSLKLWLILPRLGFNAHNASLGLVSWHPNYLSHENIIFH